jgi:hypothetical protein
MKNKLLLMASVLIPFIHIMLYVWSTGGSTVFRDDIYLVKGAVVEKFCDGTLEFADLWRPTGGSRILGYNLLLMANTAWFGLNSRLVVRLIPFVLLATAFLLFKDYSKSLAGLCTPAWIAATYALPMLLVFNLTMWEGFAFDYAIIFIWSIPWFLASFYALEGVVLKGGWRSWLPAIVILGLAFLVFGQSSSFAFGTALVTTFACRIALNRRDLPRGFVSRVLAGGAVLMLIAMIYLYRIKDNDFFPATQYLDWSFLTNPWDTVRFVLASLAASIIGADASKPYLNAAAIIAVGTLVALIYGLALALFFRARMYQRTYLPLFLMAYALAFVAIMTMGRFQYGLLYGMASRYTCSTICGIIAIVWIIVFALTKSVPAARLTRSALIALIAAILLGVLWTTVLEWEIQPHRKANFHRLREIALRVDTASDEELAGFEEDPSRVRDSLRVLKNLHLSVYRSRPALLVSMKNLSLPAGSACSISTSSMSKPARIGYATLECNPAAGFSAAAVIRSAQNYVVVSESAIPAVHPTNAARIFVDSRSNITAISTGRGANSISIDTGLALVNCGLTAARVTYTLRGRAGEILATGHGVVARGAHFLKFTGQLKDLAADFNMPADFSVRIQMGALDITSDQPLAIGALRQTVNQRHETITTSAPMADLTQPLTNLPAYLPYLVDGRGYATAIDLMNSSSEIEAGTLQAFDESGAPLAVNQTIGGAGFRHKYSIPSGGIFHFQTDGSSSAVRTGWVLLTPDPGTSTPVGTGVISYSQRGILVTEFSVPAAGASTHVRAFVDLRGRYSTALAISNVSKEEASISMKAFQLDGVTAAGTLVSPLRLGGSAHTAKFVADFIPGLDTGFRGVLDISSTNPFVALALRSLNNERDDLLLTALPIADADRIVSMPVVFPQIADGREYTTEPILVNAGPQGTAIIRFYGDTGTPMDIVEDSRSMIEH